MAEYIEREDALFALRKAERGGSMTALTRLERAYAEIREMPAANVAEVVQGQWEGEGDGYADGEIVLDVWHCSQCGYCIDDGTDNPDCLPKYCPNCGAEINPTSSATYVNVRSAFHEESPDIELCCSCAMQIKEWLKSRVEEDKKDG